MVAAITVKLSCFAGGWPRLADVFIAGGGLPVSDPSGLARASNARPGSACDHLTGALRGLPPYPLKES